MLIGITLALAEQRFRSGDGGSGRPALKPQGSEEWFENFGAISSVVISNDMRWQNSEIATIQRHQIREFVKDNEKDIREAQTTN